MNAQIQIKQIHPTEAQSLLDNLYDKQRSIRSKRVDKLASEMRAGTFRMSPDAILLIRGKLANGQHRMKAVVESGKSQEFLILTTNDESIFKIVDCGLGRSIGDAMDIPHSSNITAAARWILAMQNDEATVAAGISNSRRTRSEVIAFIENNRDKLTEAVVLCSHLYKQSMLVPLSMASALMFLSDNSDKCAGFFRQLYLGENCVGVVNELRNRLIANRGSKTRIMSGYIMAILIKAYSAFMTGKKLMIIKVASSEPFPKLAVE